MQNRTINDRQIVGVNIRAWRAQHNLRQSEVAARAGVTQGFVSAVERGKKPLGLSTLRKFADATGMTISELTAPRG